MFTWMTKLIDAVPQEWSPALRPANPNETVLGKLPGDIWKAFLGASFAAEEAKRLQGEATRKDEAHTDSHLIDEVPADENCAAHHKEVARLESEAQKLGGRAQILNYAVTEAIRDHFADAGEGTLDIRAEGVVLIPKPENALGDIMDLAGLVALLVGDGPRSSARRPSFADLLDKGRQ